MGFVHLIGGAMAVVGRVEALHRMAWALTEAEPATCGFWPRVAAANQASAG